ncbi:MAG: NAD(P)H-dependent oxidoreductase subunit E [Waddliaceae bacterium]|jgi:NADH-quinone oxidoreductase subunit E|nr:NAD(P)H-dependent oxidoreductase subunit E [Waddliaceae bacterium]MBT3579431.1 NAD(P)H-dependent oxidoreductase subunit E [Waddliaceae bacterium]MBT4445184.1 NAD(P)H-dependent oxidoreductase subunit E [Waddliaceae bacterium]MBT6928151.1 NAD(P)H-dependent oxidoreductase subunit E [Waddliaceae bacterium]MBT7264484.1 NAD(P)H-dependent oxidoreductase subunit E [Waddliaceae bacterium]
MTQEWKKEVDAIIAEKGSNSKALMPCLHAIQKKDRYISREAITFLRKALSVNPIDIYGVITFYGMYTTEKQGENVIRVCRSLPCSLGGHKDVADAIREELGIGDGETTADGKFTFEEVSCLGLCDKAPAVIVNEEVFENMTAEKVRELIKGRR